MAPALSPPAPADAGAPPPRQDDPTLEAAGLTVVHVDDDLLVVDKPAGLLSVPGRGPGKADCAARRAALQWPQVLVVHRLDEATSGLLVFARGPQAQRRLSAAFERREVEKHYVAVVNGLPEQDQGEILLPLAADWPRRPRQRVAPLDGRPAQTRWQVLERDGRAGRTRLALQPRTGRSHQLRVHLAGIGHPILGDRLYAEDSIAAAAPRLLLHASALVLPHPATGQPLALRSAPPF